MKRKYLTLGRDEIEIGTMNIDDIQPWEGNLLIYNPPSEERIYSLAKNINEFGQLEPIVISRDGYIISGNTRYKACKYLKLKEVKIRVLDIFFYSEDFTIIAKAFNNQRKKTDEEILKEFNLIELTPQEICRKNAQTWLKERKSADFKAYDGKILKRKKTTKYDNDIINACIQIINNSEYPLTVRAVHYQLLNYNIRIQRNNHIYSNCKGDYMYLSGLLTKLRINKVISFDDIIDNTRKLTERMIYDDVSSYMKEFNEDYGYSYYRNLLKTQNRTYIVVCEKETLSGPIKKICYEYGIGVVFSKGMASIDVIYRTYNHFLKNGSRPLHIFFLTDFDPTGIAIQNSYLSSLDRDFDIKPTFTRVGITPELIKNFNLPPDNEIKLSDNKVKKFMAVYNTRNVYELEAMKIDHLMTELDNQIIYCIDLELYNIEYEKYKDDLLKLNSQRNAITSLFTYL